MKRPAKTAAELEAMIRVEMEGVCEWPIGIAVSVRPDGGTWQVIVRSEGSDSSAGLVEVIQMISERLRSEYDLTD